MTTGALLPGPAQSGLHNLPSKYSCVHKCFDRLSLSANRRNLLELHNTTPKLTDSGRRPQPPTTHTYAHTHTTPPSLSSHSSAVCVHTAVWAERW